MTEFKFLTIESLHKLYKQGNVSFPEIINLQIDHIKQVENKIYSLVNFNSEEYLKLSKRHKNEELNQHYINDIPIAVKDLIDVQDLKTEANSESLKNNVAKYDSDVVKILKSNGSFVGMKTNTHEYAYGAVTPPTKNPWNLNSIPGGSSGGSAAAVACGIAIGALGSDTAGSIREPAALCSVVGFKPTINLISLKGVVPLAWTLDVVGPITKTVTDCAILFSAISNQYDLEKDINYKKDYKLGILSEYFSPMDKSIKKMYQSALSSIEEKYQCSETTSWNIDEVISTIFLILTAESAAFLEEPIKKNPDLFGGDVKQFVQMGSEFSATEYLNAQRARNLIVKSVDKLFDKFDFLIAPAQLMHPPSPENETVDLDGEELPRDLNLIKPLVLSSLCGYPAISIPFVRNNNSESFSIQIIAKRGRDSDLLDFSRVLEEEFQLKFEYPPHL